MRRVAASVVMMLLVCLAYGKKPRWNELEGYTFEQYKQDFKKPYDASNHEMRKAIFEENLARIKDLNSCHKRTWRAGVNMFTDMSTKEFKAYNRFKKSADPSVRANAKRVHQAPAADEVPLPLTVDWRQADSPRVLTAVKHQGSCGSCWAHSAAESIESQYALLTGMLPVLSVGQINSCTPNENPYWSAGCDGGDYAGAWAYLANTSVDRPVVQQAVTENWAYPIPLKDWFFDTQVNYTTSACFDISSEWKTPTTAWFAELTAAGVSGMGTVNSNNQTGGPAAMKALRDVGPQSVSVAAGNWQWYESGVFNNTNSSGEVNEWQIDHAVQMVGYGYDKELNENYWIVRNSWATLWGEDGFIRLWRAKDGQQEPCGGADVNEGQIACGTSGVLSDVMYPIVFESTPTKFG